MVVVVRCLGVDLFSSLIFWTFGSKACLSREPENGGQNNTDIMYVVHFNYLISETQYTTVHICRGSESNKCNDFILCFLGKIIVLKWQFNKFIYLPLLAKDAARRLAASRCSADGFVRLERTVVHDYLWLWSPADWLNCISLTAALKYKWPCQAAYCLLQQASIISTY